MRHWLVVVLFMLSPITASWANTAEEQTAQHFAEIKANPPELSSFLRDMPKGGDLHHHMDGSTYAENLITYGRDDGYCINPDDYSVTKNPACPKEWQLKEIENNADLYNKVLNAWSMRMFPKTLPGHDHFFDTFLKFAPIYMPHQGEVLTEIVKRAGEENTGYLELINFFQPDAVIALGQKLKWPNDYDTLRQQAFKGGLKKIVAQMGKDIDANEAYMRKALKCGTNEADAGCETTVRYQGFAFRTLPPNVIFTQFLAVFELASQDQRVAAVNFVGPEENPISMRDYAEHMRMVGYLHKLYPNVHITLHAGELAPDLVTPEGLNDHTRQAIEVAHAERVGHGVDIAHEVDSKQLLDEMAQKHIVVETNLTSNSDILGIRGKDHPLPLYLKHNVPVTISTDDQGVLRTNLMNEYQRAILNYDLDYDTVKQLVRNNLTYSFLEGDSLWQDHKVNPACQADTLGSDQPSNSCAKLLKNSEKATKQWNLEQRFNKFEQQFG